MIPGNIEAPGSFITIGRHFLSEHIGDIDRAARLEKHVALIRNRCGKSNAGRLIERLIGGKFFYFRLSVAFPAMRSSMSAPTSYPSPVPVISGRVAPDEMKMAP